MALPIATNFNFMGNEIQNVNLQKLPAAPNNPTESQIYYNTQLKRAFIYNGSIWVGLDAIDAVTTGAAIVEAINNQENKIDISKINVGVFSDTKDGLVPKPSAAGEAGKFLRGDGIWVKPTDTTYNEFSTTESGLVPMASSSGAVEKYLKGDGTWDKPTNTTYGPFTTTTDGLVPKSSATGDTGKFLQGDGTWSKPTDTWNANTKDTDGYVTKGNGQSNKVWKTDAQGIPGWRDDTDTIVPVVDGLDSTSTTNALSANQGKVLDGKITTAQSNAQSAANSYTDGKIAALIGGAPEVLDTLIELAEALGEDPNFSETILSALGDKTEKYTEVIGDNIKTSFEITHNMNSRAVTVQVFQNGSPWAMVLCDVELTTVNKATVRFSKAPASSEYRVVVIG